MDEMNVVYSTSNDYAICTGISIESLCFNNSDVHINIYVLITDLNADNKKKIDSIGKKNHVKITFINITKKLSNVFNNNKTSLLHGAYNTYARLYINQLFPELKRVLFLDSDTLVIGSLKKLYTLDLYGNIIGAVPELGVYNKNIEIEDYNVLENCKKYFNAGIILFDLIQWRAQNIDNKIKNIIDIYPNKFICMEQSILNIVLNNQCYYLGYEYNYYTILHGREFHELKRNYPDQDFLFEADIKQAKENLKIIHFVGKDYVRPWYNNNVSFYDLKYQWYKRRTLWNENKNEIDFSKDNLLKNIYNKIMYLLLKRHKYIAYDFIICRLMPTIRNLKGKFKL